MDDREQELKEVPHRLADKSRWPKGIRSISIDEADALGTDAKGELYWHGKPVEIRRPLDLTWRQKLVAGIVATATVIAAVGAARHGLGGLPRATVHRDRVCALRTWAGCSFGPLPTLSARIHR